MGRVVVRLLKHLTLVGLACAFLGAGVGLYLLTGLILGLAGPFLAALLVLYVGADIYDTVFRTSVTHD